MQLPVMLSGGGPSPSSPRDEVETQYEAATTLLQSPRGLELLYNLNLHEEKRFRELTEVVGGSPNTLSSRLSEGVEAGLIEVKYPPSEHGTKKVYSYTTRGQNFRQELEQRNIFHLHQKIETLQEELDEYIDEFKDVLDQRYYSIHPPQDQDRDVHR